MGRRSAALDSQRYTEMKRKRIITGITIASALLLLLLGVAVFMSYNRESQFQFLSQYEGDEQKAMWGEGYTGKVVVYHFKADYDIFAKAAKSNLLAQGFNERTRPSKFCNGPIYEKIGFKRVEAKINFAVIRSGSATSKPLYSWIDVTVTRTKPKPSLKNYWKYLKTEYYKLKFKLLYNHPLPS